MKYSEYAQIDQYVSKQSGSHVAIIMIDSANPTVPLVSASTGINWNGDYEKNVVEEAGEDGPNEITDGRYGGCQGSMTLLFTPERNDRLPTRQDFIDREFTIMEVVGFGRQGEGTPLNVITGAKLSQHGSSHGARGLKTVNVSFVGLRRYNGLEWAAKAGGN